MNKINSLIWIFCIILLLTQRVNALTSSSSSYLISNAALSIYDYETGRGNPVSADKPLEMYNERDAGGKGGQSHGEQSTLARQATGYDAGTAHARRKEPRITRRRPSTTTDRYSKQRGVTGITDKKLLSRTQRDRDRHPWKFTTTGKIDPEKVTEKEVQAYHDAQDESPQRVRHNPKFSRGKNPTGEKTGMIQTSTGGILVRGRKRRLENPLGDPRKIKAVIELTEALKKRKKAPHGESAADYEKYLDLDPIDENIENQ